LGWTCSDETLSLLVDPVGLVTKTTLQKKNSKFETATLSPSFLLFFAVPNKKKHQWALRMHKKRGADDE